MRDQFHWKRDTERFHVYVAATRKNGKHEVLYLPRDRVINHTRPLECITSARAAGIQCCHLDNDYDGNCRIHSAPGVFRAGSAEEAIRQGELIHQRAAGGFVSRQWFPERLVTLNEFREWQRRVERTEQRVNILFKACAKLIKIVRRRRCLWRPHAN